VGNGVAVAEAGGVCGLYGSGNGGGRRDGDDAAFAMTIKEGGRGRGWIDRSGFDG